MTQNPAEVIAKGITPYDYKNPPFSLIDKDIPAVRVVEAMDRAGFPESEWVTGVAVARRESSLVPDLIGAVDSNSRDYDPENASWDFGLFQISYQWNPHLMEGPKKIGEWDDPDDNAKMAKYLFDESIRRGHEGWRPWHTWTSGNYRGKNDEYIRLAEEAVAEYKRDAPAKKPVTTSKEEPTVTELVVTYRADLGWGATGASYASVRTGLAVHFDGGTELGLADKDHSACIAKWNNNRNFHTGPQRGWTDIGYAWGVCQHGVAFEGRGFDRQQAAQPGGNTSHQSVYFFIGGNESPTKAAIECFKLLRKHLRSRGVGSEIRPHSSFIATSCPGNALRALIADGTLGATTSTPVSPQPSGSVSAPSTGTGGLTTVRSVEYQQDAVNDAGYTPKLVKDNRWGPKTEAGVKWLQDKLGVEDDSLWGPVTDKAHQNSKKGGSPVSKKKVSEDGILGEETISELQRALNRGDF